MLSPAIITLPWRPDAAEHYFTPLSALPWACLLYTSDVYKRQGFAFVQRNPGILFHHRGEAPGHRPTAEGCQDLGDVYKRQGCTARYVGYSWRGNIR